ncbi:hypothetical protein TMEN_4382 [Trichophyton mentagrophytes]|uniref:Uncharacterized protein n=1 Tax=Trichophyton interdigitale (strain MR816) TaxID=1215338 RepID=A0A059JHS5_TRIIM|nr:hypothetical protein H101_02280 [Trichophyton interdigitale H6]KDB27188.1 hypothetical protein H109_01058 [Trichophyton interdigitale MR816]GBF61864.1 hypothetical protein TMEN_4382 [Trichophyton mentagrophytes]
MPRSRSSGTGRTRKGKKKKSPKAPAREKKILPPCGALTHSFVPCKNRSNRKASRKIPVCWAHRKQGETVTRCQAVLENNRKCLKKIPWSERRQVCTKHADSPLPCFILRLPIELRQQIFTYILDGYRREYVAFYTYFNILKTARLNRQIYQEVCDLLHRKLVCNIVLMERRVCIFGKLSRSVRPGSWQRFKQFRFQFPGSGIDKAVINNLTIIVPLLRDSCMKLSVGPFHISFFYGNRRVEQAIDSLQSSLDIFRQLRGLREARIDTCSDFLDGLKRYGLNALKLEDRMAITSKWESYCKQWVEDLERGHSAERADS